MSELQTTESVGHPEPAGHSEATFLGLDPGGWVALAMLAVFAILIWKKVPGAIGKALDDRIRLIRDQLAEAEDLRKEAEALKKEYEKKSRSADKDAAALLERARHEADEIVVKAKSDAQALIERRTRMAEDKIAAEERSAVDQLRAAAADAATKAAARIIAERHDSKSDEQLVNQAIKEIARR